MREASCLSLRACVNSSVRRPITPLGWNPGLYGAGERRGEGEGDGLDEADVEGTNREVERGGSWPDDSEGIAKDALGVWDGLG